MSLAGVIRQKVEKSGESFLEMDLFIAARASRSRIAAIYDNRLKIQLTAAPVDGEANAELLVFLSKLFKLPKANFAISSGLTSKRKVVNIRGIALEEALKTLSSSLKHAK